MIAHRVRAPRQPRVLPSDKPFPASVQFDPILTRDLTEYDLIPQSVEERIRRASHSGVSQLMARAEWFDATMDDRIGMV